MHSLCIKDTIIRIEEPQDYRASEEVTREAFWNLWAPGADEHFILHRLRNQPEFVKELCLVAEIAGQIVGCIAYSTSVILDANDVEHKVLTFGPVGVSPAKKGKGVGSSLIRESMNKARDLGYGAVIIQGYPCYYNRFGFQNGKVFNISSSDGTFPKALLVMELIPGALNGISGKFIDSPVFRTDPDACMEFDKTFPPKEKFVTVSQKAFEFISPLLEEDPEPLDWYRVCQSLERVEDPTIDI